MQINLPGFANGAPIPVKYAFGKVDSETHVALSDNSNPEITWTDLPVATESLVLLCVDKDVPSVGDDVNQEGKTVSADLPRVDFYHWVMIDINPQLNSIPEGADSNSVTAKGKTIGKTDYGVRGINDYTNWFAGDPDMQGNYGGYDGPCPPWNDELLHHYYFQLYALDIKSLNLSDAFTGEEVKQTMQNHILASSEWVGTYSLNPKL